MSPFTKGRRSPHTAPRSWTHRWAAWRGTRAERAADGWIDALGDWPKGRSEATTDDVLEALGLGNGSGRELHIRRMHAGIVLRRLGFTRTLQRRDDWGTYERRIYPRPSDGGPIAERLAPWLAERTEANVSDAVAFLGLDVTAQNAPTARRIVEAFRRAGFIRPAPSPGHPRPARPRAASGPAPPAEPYA